jgi:hypothetical protein
MAINVDPNHILLHFTHREDIGPDDEVEWWGAEGVAEVIDDGGPRNWLKLANAIAADPEGLPGEYLSKCTKWRSTRPDLVAALNATMQSAIDEEDAPVRHVNAILPGLPGRVLGPFR